MVVERRRECVGEVPIMEENSGVYWIIVRASLVSGLNKALRRISECL